MAIILSHADVVRVLALSHNIDREKHEVAFKGRLQHFQRLGFPEGVNTGRGRPARYGPGELLLMALALQLTQLGLTPERAVNVLNDNAYVVVPATRIAADGMLNDEPNFGMFLWFDPAALSHMSVRKSDRASETFFYGGLAVLKERLDAWAANFFVERLALINLSVVLHDLSSFLMTINAAEPEDFWRELRDWAGERTDVDGGYSQT